MTTGPASSLCGRFPAVSLDAEQRDLVLAEKQLSVTPKLDQIAGVCARREHSSHRPADAEHGGSSQGPADAAGLSVGPSLKHAGEGVPGEVYSDDGHTFSFRQGAYARIQFTCAVAADGSVSVTIGKQEGTWKPWWRAYRIEVVGWTPKQKRGR